MSILCAQGAHIETAEQHLLETPSVDNNIFINILTSMVKADSGIQILRHIHHQENILILNLIVPHFYKKDPPVGL